MIDFIRGIDCSSWQDNKETSQRMDFKKAKAAGVEFAIIRACYGTTTDREFYYNWKAAGDEGMPRGTYAFLQWNIDPQVQARYFVDLFRNIAMPEMAFVVDFEWWSTVPPDAIKWLYGFGKELIRLVPTPKNKHMVYTAPAFWNQYGIKADTFWSDNFDLWVAGYGMSTRPPVEPPVRIKNMIPAPWVTERIWQYSSKGPGYAMGAESGDIDLNRFNGSRAEFEKYCGIVTKPVEPTDTEKLALMWADYKERKG